MRVCHVCRPSASLRWKRGAHVLNPRYTRSSGDCCALATAVEPPPLPPAPPLPTPPTSSRGSVGPHAAQHQQQLPASAPTPPQPRAELVFMAAEDRPGSPCTAGCRLPSPWKSAALDVAPASSTAVDVSGAMGDEPWQHLMVAASSSGALMLVGVAAGGARAGVLSEVSWPRVRGAIHPC